MGGAFHGGRLLLFVPQASTRDIARAGRYDLAATSCDGEASDISEPLGPIDIAAFGQFDIGHIGYNDRVFAAKSEIKAFDGPFARQMHYGAACDLCGLGPARG